ncbi:hypothetical protein J7J58_06275 [candidate division WOR-3 bacterium]|nr:hypothetical protein [candidate division WOR-3 bacterium]
MQRVETFSLNKILNRVPKWIERESKYLDVVLFTRILLFRNIEGYKFPEMAKTLDMVGLSKNIFTILSKYNRGEEKFEYLYGMDMTDVEFAAIKEYLKFGDSLFRTERDKVGIAVNENLNLFVITNADNHLAFVINTREDQLREGYSYVYDLEQFCENYFSYSFNGTFGYLTSSLDDTGTGLRIKFLLDLPGVVFKNKINFIKKLAAGLNMSIDEFPDYNYGESSFFILTNKITVGFAEDEIIRMAFNALKQIIDAEHRYREDLFRSIKFKDKVIRNYAIFRNSLLIKDNEIYKIMSLLRMGVISGHIKDMTLVDISRIFNELGRNYLRYIYNIKSSEAMTEVMRIRKEHVNKLMRYG